MTCVQANWQVAAYEVIGTPTQAAFWHDWLMVGHSVSDWLNKKTYIHGFSMDFFVIVIYYMSSGWRRSLSFRPASITPVECMELDGVT